MNITKCSLTVVYTSYNVSHLPIMIVVNMCAQSLNSGKSCSTNRASSKHVYLAGKRPVDVKASVKSISISTKLE